MLIMVLACMMHVIIILGYVRWLLGVVASNSNIAAFSLLHLILILLYMHYLEYKNPLSLVS
jgi:hypothetical protein